jgi:anti-anti-sigma factor
MHLKIDTKEKFHELSPGEAHIPANMTADFEKTLTELQNLAPHNIILNMELVKTMDTEAGKMLMQAQARSYESSQSFVICQLDPAVEDILDKAELLELLNVTPTLSEAWDIIQMEEIERELLDGLE